MSTTRFQHEAQAEAQQPGRVLGLGYRLAPTCVSSLPADLLAHDGGGLGHRLELAERGGAGEVLHAAVGCQDQAIGAYVLQAGADATRHHLRRLHRLVAQIDDAEDHALALQLGQHGEVDVGLRALDRDLFGRRSGQLGQERIALRLVRHELGIAKAQVHGGLDLQAGERAIYGLDGKTARRLRVVAQPRLVELDHVGAGLLEGPHLLVDGVCECHRQCFEVLVVLVLHLLGHRERAGQRDLDALCSVGAQELDVAHLDRPRPADRASYPRYGRGAAGAGRLQIFTKVMLPIVSPGILTVALIIGRNISRGAKDVALFEIGSVFRNIREVVDAGEIAVEHRPSEEQIEGIFAALPDQPLHIAGVISGNGELKGWWGSGRKFDWSDAVSMAIRIVEETGNQYQIVNSDFAPWHTGRCAEIIVAGKAVAHAGELHPRVIAELALPERSCAFVVALSALPFHAVIKANPVWTMPAAFQDISLVVSASTSASSVEQALREGAGELLESISLFDRYDQLGDDQLSLAYTMTFRAPDRTLTAAEVSTFRESAGLSATLKCGAIIRG